MNVNEYRDKVHKDIAISAEANISSLEEEFLNYVTDILIEADEFDEFIESYYEGITKKKGNMKIDGYAFDESDNSCCIFILDYHGDGENDSINNDNIKTLFKKIRFFVEESIKNRLYLNLEESTQVYEFSKILYEDMDSITKFRFFLITDAFNKQRNKNIKDEELFNKKVELNVWDINRIFDLVNSKSRKESIEIDFDDFKYDGIPCVKAVEYKNIQADVDDEILKLKSDEKSENIITYSSYLAVVPGEILKDLYLEYGSRLLEGNVRSFLSVRGKVNKSIQNTIKNYPEMFFAYNNGIAATATEIKTESSSDGLKIKYIKDLQIVNGGQTTASIANTVLNAKKNDNVDISNLFVPMKLSVLEQEMSEKIIPKISQYSNSQNKVDASDFFSNHPFHIRMEDYSRKTPAPARNGEQYQTYWYYERTRGQYNQVKIKYKPKSAQLKQYEIRYPEKQVIKMVDLAKYMEIYNSNPHIVSKGKQVIVKEFAKEVKSKWLESNEEYNLYYFKRIVALAIIYKKTDEIIKNTSWYKEKKSYKANVIAYTLSIIFDFIRKNKRGYEIDFMKIWNEQKVYPEFCLEIKNLCTEVYKFITRDDRLTENVTEWCKKEICWERAKKEKWNIGESFLNTLIKKEELKTVAMEAKANRKIETEIEDIKLIMNLGDSYWKKVLNWGRERNLILELEESILKILINMSITGKIPSEKQIKVIMKMRKKLINEGMPDNLFKK